MSSKHLLGKCGQCIYFVFPNLCKRYPDNSDTHDKNDWCGEFDDGVCF